MASYDNEIYRGPPEAGPTLERDIRSYGSDVYIVKSEINTLKQDVPPTEEPIRQESKPVKKKESKIAKAMKLLASCTAAAAIATNITAATTLEPVLPDSDLPEWPQFGYIEDNLNGHSVFTPSQHGNMVQVSTGSRTFRITAKQEDLHLFWTTTYNIEHNPNREGFNLMIENWNEGWFLDVSFHLYPQTGAWIENELMSQFTTPSGETFYLRAFLSNGEESTKERTADIMARLSDYIEFSEATEDGWGKVLIGETMISDTKSHWNGILTTPEVSTDFCFSRINQKQYADYTEDQFIRSMTINDIDWSFYYSFDEYSLYLWAVPAQEDIALASGLDFIVNDMGLTVSELQHGSEETKAVLTDYLNLAVDLAADICFSNYHLYDNPNWSPAAPPDSPVEPPTVPAPTEPMPTDPGTIHFDYFDANVEFTIEGRSFLMLNWRDDVLLRHHYTGEDHVQIDLATTDGQLRVNLIVGTGPNGSEYLSYPLENGLELYTAVFNHWGDPWIYDEDMLFDMNQNLSDYVRIIETTAYDEIIEPTTPDPYSDLPEYTQYSITESGMSYSPFARSNRVCHFSTNGGNYRLDAQTPDMFMLWETYYYDLKEESANSYITLNNIAESWSMGVWVFDAPVESVYDSFTLTTEDGTTLWFYIANFDDFTQQDRLEAVLSQLPDLVHLSRAEDGHWSKVLYGETLISDVTSSWSGLAYTANNDDFWYFEQLIGRYDDLQSYNLRIADSRTVNGTTWNFYTTGGSNGYGITAGKEFYHTQVFAVPIGGDVCFVTSLYNGLTLPENEFSNQAEYEAYIDANVHLAIDTIVSQGLSNFHLYTSIDNSTTDFPDYEEETSDPYSYLPEFRQYRFQGGISYNLEARSNRICQFATKRGAYRLEAQTPDVFIFWETYYYLSQDKLEYSMISIRHKKEDWQLDLAVFDQPVDLDFPYGGFSLTSEDGTELWFYEIVGNSFEQDHLQSIINRLPELVKLSAAQDDGWGKFRIGETMIVNQTPYWSGMEYTVGGEDFWKFGDFGHSSWIAEYDLRFAGSREVNGIQWDFYTTGSALRDGSGKVVDGVYQPTEIYLTNIYAVAAQEEIYLDVELEIYHYKDGGLSLPEYEFSSRAEYDACLDANIGSIIDTIVSQGLSNFYPYSE